MSPPSFSWGTGMVQACCTERYVPESLCGSTTVRITSRSTATLRSSNDSRLNLRTVTGAASTSCPRRRDARWTAWSQTSDNRTISCRHSCCFLRPRPRLMTSFFCRCMSSMAVTNDIRRTTHSAPRRCALFNTSASRPSHLRPLP